MKLKGVVKGQTIELDSDPELPDGQRVLVELAIPATEPIPQPSTDAGLEFLIATDPGFESIRQVRSLREAIAIRLGGPLPSSVEAIRADRSR